MATESNLDIEIKFRFEGLPLVIIRGLMEFLPNFAQEQIISKMCLAREFVKAWRTHTNLAPQYVFCYSLNCQVTPNDKYRLWLIAKPTDDSLIDYGNRLEIILFCCKLFSEICDRNDAQDVVYDLQNALELSMRHFDLRTCSDVYAWRQIMYAYYAAIVRIRERFNLGNYEPCCCPALLAFIKDGEFELFIS